MPKTEEQAPFEIEASHPAPPRQVAIPSNLSNAPQSVLVNESEGVEVTHPPAPSKPLITGGWAAALGVLAALASFAAGTSLVVWPWNALLAVVAMAVGLVTASFSGVPSIFVGRPLIPVTAIPGALAASVWLAELASTLPEGTGKGLALAGAAVLCWLCGKTFEMPVPKILKRVA